jgi:predicted acetylornithine/succinylornithine family transaminase
MPDNAVLAAPPVAPGLALEETGLHAPVYPLPRLELASGKGARVTDVTGRTYLDFVSGIAVNAFGHAPDGLAEVVAAQLGTLGHCSNLFANRPAVELARELVAATGYDRAFFCNSGAEGVEAALKFSRARAVSNGKAGRDIVAFRGGFHGRTGFALSATWNPPYREPFQPLIPGVRFADFNDVAGLDAVLDENVCAVIVECVQGESGAVPATREFLLALRERATALGAALVFDEVQTGMGRTGRLLAQEHFGVRGEYTVMSKALGAGLPIAAVLMTADAASSLAPGMHGCTFGGNPVCAAAARWSLARVNDGAFLEGVRRSAALLERGLAALAVKHATVREARGLGLLRAVDLDEAAPFGAAQLVAAAREQGLLLVRGGERAVRLLPPLNVSHDEITEALGALDRALTSLQNSGESK